jgi:hypothetical protein
MQFFHYSQEDGRVDQDLVIDPSDPSGLSVADEFAHHIAPFINEPSGVQDKRHGHPNCLWVRNFRRKRIEIWTRVPLEPGAELTLCYGSTYDRSKYPRGTRVHCASRLNPIWKSVEPSYRVFMEPPSGVVFPWERLNAYPSWLYDAESGEEPYEPSVKNYGRFLSSGKSPWGPGPKPDTKKYATLQGSNEPRYAPADAKHYLRTRCVDPVAGTVVHGVYDRRRARRELPPFHVDGAGWLSGAEYEKLGGRAASKKWKQSIEGAEGDGPYTRFSQILEREQRSVARERPARKTFSARGTFVTRPARKTVSTRGAFVTRPARKTISTGPAGIRESDLPFKKRYIPPLNELNTTLPLKKRHRST